MFLCKSSVGRVSYDEYTIDDVKQTNPCIRIDTIQEKF